MQEKYTNYKKAGVFFLAGRESHASNPLVLGFILVARKLEKLGFRYAKHAVFAIDPSEMQRY